MGDSLKLSKEKRHRSSSSLAGAAIESTRSERKLEIGDFIPEVDDQFSIAETRCKDLEEKLDLIKTLKKKKKLKKRSMTKILTEEPTTAEHVPFITVHTQPKKTLLVTEVSQDNARLRRVQTPQNPTRGYLDPATVEQHRMIGQVRGYNNAFKPPHDQRVNSGKQSKAFHGTEHSKTRQKQSRSHAQGDNAPGQISLKQRPHEVACGQDTSIDYYDVHHEYEPKKEEAPSKKTMSARRRHVPKDVPIKEERPVVELYNKNYGYQQQNQIEAKPKKGQNQNAPDDISGNRILKQTSSLIKKCPRKYRSRRYELPTVASQMKEAGMRYYYETVNRSNIPFVVSKSTTPSHNIGMNIQQVLNGLKIQQPLSRIPLTIAHHMGLGRVPVKLNKRSQPVISSLDHRMINAIRVGHRLVRLPSYKFISYNRLLSLYREGDGMVPRFLRAMSRPHYFYTSMYNLTTYGDDFDAATSKGHASSQIAQKNLKEFANLYQEYKRISKIINEGKYDPDLLLRKEELSKQLVAREQLICKVVQDYKSVLNADQTLRASASAAEDYRHSSFKLDQ